jgi:hypothetical protein
MQKILSDWKAVFAVRCRLEFLDLLATDTPLLPDTPDPVHTHMDAFRRKFRLQPARAIGATGPLVSRFNRYRQPGIFLSLRRVR